MKELPDGDIAIDKETYYGMRDQIQELQAEQDRLRKCLRVVARYFDTSVGWKHDDTGTLDEALSEEYNA